MKSGQRVSLTTRLYTISWCAVTVSSAKACCTADSCRSGRHPQHKTPIRLRMPTAR